MGGNIPMIKNSKYGVIIRHKEYIADILATGAFTNNTFSINPGMAQTFPWLSQVANAFEEYEFRGLLFTFKSMSSDALLMTATNSSLGTVVMGTQYDVIDQPFSNKVIMENHQYSNSAKPSISQTHMIECARAQMVNTHLYTRPGAIPDNADARLYDLGRFQIATQGMQTNGGICGELWVSYEIQLFKPQLFDYAGGGLAYDVWRLSTGNTATLAFTPFGDVNGVQPIKISGNLGTTVNTTLSANAGGGAGVVQGYMAFEFPRERSIGVYQITYLACSRNSPPTNSVSLPLVAVQNSVLAAPTGIQSRNVRTLLFPWLDFPPAIIAGTVGGVQAPQASTTLAGGAGFDIMYQTYVQLTGPYTLPALPDAAAVPNPVLKISHQGTTGTDQYPGSAGAWLLIQQVNPLLCNLSNF